MHESHCLRNGALYWAGATKRFRHDRKELQTGRRHDQAVEWQERPWRICMIFEHDQRHLRLQMKYWNGIHDDVTVCVLNTGGSFVILIVAGAAKCHCTGTSTMLALLVRPLVLLNLQPDQPFHFDTDLNRYQTVLHAFDFPVSFVSRSFIDGGVLLESLVSPFPYA